MTPYKEYHKNINDNNNNNIMNPNERTTNQNLPAVQSYDNNTNSRRTDTLIRQLSSSGNNDYDTAVASFLMNQQTAGRLKTAAGEDDNYCDQDWTNLLSIAGNQSLTQDIQRNLYCSDYPNQELSDAEYAAMLQSELQSRESAEIQREEAQKAARERELQDEEMARRLQAEYSNGNSFSSFNFEEVQRQARRQEELDAELASQLQREFEEKPVPRSEIQNVIESQAEYSTRQDTAYPSMNSNSNEEPDMLLSSTHVGCSFLFVQQALDLQKSLSLHHGDDDGVGPVARDDMVAMTERLMDVQAAFKLAGKDTFVDIGYHYTNEAALSQIRREGLYTKSDRMANNVASIRSNGSFFGDGIYTANDPWTFASAYGNVGLLVARLQGVRRRVKPEECRNGANQYDWSYDTAVGNKRRIDLVDIDLDGQKYDDDNDEVVLRSSSQCIPLLQFHINSWKNANEEYHDLNTYHQAMQGLIDTFFNDGQQTERRDLPRRRGTTTAATTPMTATATAPAIQATLMSSPVSNFHQETFLKRYKYKAPTRIISNDFPYEIQSDMRRHCHHDCNICLDRLGDGENRLVGRLNVCQHIFHIDCLTEALDFSKKCPLCRKSIHTPQGQSPSGCMDVYLDEGLRCAGFEQFSTFVLKYTIPNSNQRSFHPSAGTPFVGTREKKAYLPDCPEGRNLLNRLVYAFMCGLTFEVGRNNQSYRLIWGSIPHKTSSRGGFYGFPDQQYIWECNDTLDSFGVPSDVSEADLRDLQESAIRQR